MGKPPRRNPWEDHYTRQARKAKYPARSVFKLQEIQKRVGLIRPGDRVLDLGCAPGAWTLYAAEQVGPGGRVLGIDLTPLTVALPPQAEAVQGDVFALGQEVRRKMSDGFDVVLSDMAPATTGHGPTDAARSEALCEAALGIAAEVLAEGGHFVCKIFQGAGFEAFRDAVRAAFERMRIVKPQSSRKASREIFIVGLGKHGRI
jgi:23S rRNA (uridine2552-2'-O)-methyltransferase